MTAANKTVWSVIWSVAEAGGVFGLQFIAILVMARLIGPADFGVAALASSVIMLLSLLVTALFGDAIVQRHDLSKSHLDTAFWTALGISAFIVGGCWISAPILATHFEEPELAPVLIWMSLSILAQGASSVHIAKLRRDLDFKSVALRHLFGSLAGIIIGISMAIYGFGVWSLVAQRLAAAGVSALLVWVSSVYRPNFAYSFPRLWELLKFGLAILGNHFLYNSSQRFFSLFVGAYFGTTALGFVDIAYRMAVNLRRLISSALHNVALPYISKQQHDRQRLIPGLQRAVAFTALMTQPLFAGLAVCAQEVVVIVLGSQWLPAVPLVQILCVVVMLQTARQLYGTTTMAIGKPLINTMSMLASLLLSLTFVFAFGRNDLVIATLAWTGSITVIWPVMMFVTRHYVGISLKDQFGAFIAPMAAAALMALVLLMVKEGFLADQVPIVVLGILVPLGIVSYVGTVMILRPKLIPSFADFILSAVKRKKAKPAE